MKRRPVLSEEENEFSRGDQAQITGELLCSSENTSSSVFVMVFSMITDPFLEPSTPKFCDGDKAIFEQKPGLTYCVLSNIETIFIVLTSILVTVESPFAQSNELPILLTEYTPSLFKLDYIVA
jgi:hypothetical protein